MSVDRTFAITYVIASMFKFAVRVHHSATSLSSNVIMLHVGPLVAPVTMH